MTPSALAVEELAARSEDEVREHLAAGKLVEGLQHMSPDYLRGIRRILTVSADTELISAPAYLRAAQHAPALNNFGSAVSIIQDELAHAHIGYRLLGDLAIRAIDRVCTMVASATARLLHRRRFGVAWTPATTTTAAAAPMRITKARGRAPREPAPFASGVDTARRRRVRPVVPVYCRCTPAERRPFLTNPVSSATNTPAATSLGSASGSA